MVPGERKGSRPLPAFISELFQGENIRDFDIEKNRDRVIERIIETGDDEAVSWLWKAFDSRSIADVVKKSKALAPKSATLWALILDIPRERIACLRMRSAK